MDSIRYPRRKRRYVWREDFRRLLMEEGGGGVGGVLAFPVLFTANKTRTQVVPVNSAVQYDVSGSRFMFRGVVFNQTYSELTIPGGIYTLELAGFPLHPDLTFQLFLNKTAITPVIDGGCMISDRFIAPDELNTFEVRNVGLVSVALSGENGGAYLSFTRAAL